MKKTENSFTDPRDGKVYRTVKIGNQTWMAENLAYAAKGSKCYDNDPENGKKYGRLYNWETALKASPEGWNLPSKEEWDTLLNFAGGAEIAGKNLKAASGWNGMDVYGFAALPGGCGDYIYGYNYYDFKDLGNGGYWWATGKGERAYFRNINRYSDRVIREYGNERNAHGYISIRCIKNISKKLSRDQFLKMFERIKRMPRSEKGIYNNAEIYLEMVKENGFALEFVEHQTLDICLEAVKENGLALEFVYHQTLDICLEAVKENGLALELVNHQTLDICLEAVKQNPDALKFVKEALIGEVNKGKILT